MASGKPVRLSDIRDAMNPDAYPVSPTRLCSHVMHRGDDNLVYKDILRRLMHGVSVTSVAENVSLTLSFMSSIRINEISAIHTAGPRIGASLSSSEAARLINFVGKGFFVDLGVCRDGDPSQFGQFNGLTVEPPRIGSSSPPLSFDRSVLSAFMHAIIKARSFDYPGLVVGTACKLERSPDNSLLCDSFGSWYSYDADTEIVQLGSVPGEPRHVITQIGVGASSPQRSVQLISAAQEYLREMTTALEVALMPPALFEDEIPWRSIYQMGVGLEQWTRIRRLLRRGEESIQFVDGRRTFAALAFDDYRFSEENFFDPLGFFSKFIFLCAHLDKADAPKSWSKLTALEWALYMLKPGGREDAFKVWRLVVSCEHIVEVCGDTCKVAKIARHSRQLDELAGISCDGRTNIPDVIALAEGDGVKLAKACAEGFEVNIQGRLFNPEEIEPTTPEDFNVLEW